MDSQRYDGQQLVIAHSNSITLNGKIAPPPTSLSVVIVMDTGTMWLKGGGLEKGRSRVDFLFGDNHYPTELVMNVFRRSGKKFILTPNFV